MSRWCHAFLLDGLDEPLREGKTMNKLTEEQASPVFGLRYLEDREVEGLDVVGCLILNRDGSGSTATGCDDADQIVP
jgi:Ribosomally synthesized peptide in Herpetosiphon